MKLMNAGSGINKKVQQDLDSVPAAVVEIALPDDQQEIMNQSARIAFLAITHGDIQHWMEAAEMIKRDADDLLGASWHCVCGTNFGCFITNETNRVSFFSVGHMKILLFKHT
jgi:hypothetical protein